MNVQNQNRIRLEMENILVESDLALDDLWLKCAL
jgi:hypothetical protein